MGMLAALVFPVTPLSRVIDLIREFVDPSVLDADTVDRIEAFLQNPGNDDGEGISHAVLTFGTHRLSTGSVLIIRTDDNEPMVEFIWDYDCEPPVPQRATVIESLHKHAQEVARRCGIARFYASLGEPGDGSTAFFDGGTPGPLYTGRLEQEGG